MVHHLGCLPDVGLPFLIFPNSPKFSPILGFIKLFGVYQIVTRFTRLCLGIDWSGDQWHLLVVSKTAPKTGGS